MKIIITSITGSIGAAVLKLCNAKPRISEIIVPPETAIASNLGEDEGWTYSL